MKYKVIIPISLGERREVGEVVDLDKETAARYSEEIEKFVDEDGAESDEMLGAEKPKSKKKK